MPCDVGAVRLPDPGPPEQLRQTDAHVHVGAHRDERISEDAGQFADAGEVRHDADAVKVEVLR